jgi:hypothetical protein
MTTIIIIEKTGVLKEHVISGDIDIDQLHKIAKFTTGDNFENEASWEVDVDDTTYNISLFAKTTGRSGQENKYELPPPVDDVLYFGRALLINENGENLTLELWSKIYNALFGGFDDLGDDDSEDDEEEDLTGVTLTKDGYMNDSFVTDDGDKSDENYVEPKPELVEGKRARNSLRKLSHDDMESHSDTDDGDFMVCTDELEEEDYF